MVLEPMKPDPTSTEGGGGEGQKLLDREIKEIISELTSCLADLQHEKQSAAGAESADHDQDNRRGVRIITLAGSNTGATMRGDQLDIINNINDKSTTTTRPSVRGQDHLDEEEALGLGAYVNSNFQAINNSIVMGGSNSTNDPGVHMDIISSDYEDYDSDFQRRKSRSHHLNHHHDHMMIRKQHAPGKFKPVAKKKDTEDPAEASTSSRNQQYSQHNSD